MSSILKCEGIALVLIENHTHLSAFSLEVERDDFLEGFQSIYISHSARNKFCFCRYCTQLVICALITCFSRLKPLKVAEMGRCLLYELIAFPKFSIYVMHFHRTVIFRGSAGIMLPNEDTASETTLVVRPAVKSPHNRDIFIN